MKSDDDMDLVDRLLAEAAAAPEPAPDAAFMVRILADAGRLQPQACGRAAVRGKAMSGRGARAARTGGWLGGTADVLGGRAALAGMMAATVAGFCLGIVQPAALSGLSTAFYGQAPMASLDLMAGSDSLWTESLQ